MPLHSLKSSNLLLCHGNWTLSPSVIWSLSSPSFPRSSCTDLLFLKEAQLVPSSQPFHSFFSVLEQLFLLVIQDSVPMFSLQRGFHDPWHASHSQLAFLFSSDLGYSCVCGLSPCIPLRMSSLRSLLLSCSPLYV